MAETFFFFDYPPLLILPYYILFWNNIELGDKQLLFLGTMDFACRYCIDR